jgi:hypothetical protein
MQEVTQVGEPTRLHGQITNRRNDIQNLYLPAKYEALIVLVNRCRQC